MGGGCRIPPNATKLFYRWGMEERLRASSVKSAGVVFARCNDSGHVVGEHEWEEEMLEETGGDFLLIHYSDLRRILAESAVEHGATLRSGCYVVDIHADPQRPTVTLESGEVLTADVVVGADGSHVGPHCTRRTILKAIGQEDIETQTGMELFNAIIPGSALDELEDQEFADQLRKPGTVFTWFGPGHGALNFPIKEPKTGNLLFTIYIYAPSDDPDIRVRMVDKERMLKELEGRDPRLLALVKHARAISLVPMVDRPYLEDWIHPEGHVIALGESAHPIPVGSLYSVGMGAGDGAVIGRLFAHLHRRDQINSFLNAVQEIREPRVERVIRAATGNIFAVSLPPGVAEARDRDLREHAEREIQDLSGAGAMGRQTSQEMMSAIENIFAYDPEDSADDWWVQWGLMQERASRLVVSDAVHSVHVVEDMTRKAE
ncbi:3-hydroxybenzoate 6-hydroxylase [Trametes pubescens]|uniref:3-hydroxybenzoate 6-hydroxylase n=1 Tax=Trametes pubescens TaxID=154538 RepID=A0A1M2VSW6_TRAPU|nr:3-hydroxybenzoate 6-hydroxylase [Trametes pubescens]